MKSHLTHLAALLLVQGHAAVAQDAGGGDAPAVSDEAALDLGADPQEDDWIVQIEPMVWVPALDGDLTLPGGAGRADIGLLGLDENEATPGGELHFRSGRLRISLSGFGFLLDETAEAITATSVGGLDIDPGDMVRGEIDFVSAQAVGGWEIWRMDLPRDRDRAQRRTVSIAVELYGGARFYDVDVSVATSAGAASDDGAWVEPIVGGRLEVDVLDDFTLDFAVDGGLQPFGDRTSSSLDLIVGAHWRPWRHVAFQFGWRQILVDLESGDGADEFGFDTSLAGLFGSIVLRF